MLPIPHLALAPPANEKFTVQLPKRKPNAEYRSREHLTEREVERLIEAVKGNRQGHRDATMVHAASIASMLTLPAVALGAGRSSPEPMPARPTHDHVPRPSQ
jgi:hypothetical protein